MNSASLCSLAGRYENPIPPRCLAPIDLLKIPALIYGRTVQTHTIRKYFEEAHSLMSPLLKPLHTLTVTGRMLPATEREERPREGNAGIIPPVFADK